HGGQVVLFADLVESIDQLGLTGNAKFFSLGQPELLVDQIAKQVLVRLGDVLHGGATLPHLLVAFALGTVVVRLGNDLIVDARNNLFYRRAAVRTFGQRGSRLRKRKTGK